MHLKAKFAYLASHVQMLSSYQEFHVLKTEQLAEAKECKSELGPHGT